MKVEKYTDRQRLNAIAARGWNIMSDELRAAIDAEIDKQRAGHADDETWCCLDCGKPLVPCECREGCPGGNCSACLPRTASADVGELEVGR